MTTQSEALLGLVSSYLDLTPTEREQRWAVMFGNPVICTPTVYDLAHRDASERERPMLERMRHESLLVVSDTPAATRRELTTRVGYENRETRRARKRQSGKPGKAK